ncbi:MAG: TonB-dependent receptor plug domain-containing protein [Bacteroidota bacterium]|nr:TonB-dependent receptor plug domain-containing protein [Bacteroidota bacterium]
MKLPVKHFVFLLLIAGSVNRVFAQVPDYSSSKEKVYIQTNHVFFKPGDQVFFKLYLVNGQDQTPSGQSSVVYVEVINPSGNVLQKLNYRVDNGYTEGSFDFNEEAPGGIYKLRAYTTWMQNEKDSSFFVKEITLQKVIAPRVLMKLDFPKKGYGAGDEVTADYSIRNLSDQPIRYYEVKYTVSVGGTTIHTNSFKTNNEGKAQVKFRLPADLKSSDGLLNITIEYDSYTEAISRSIPIVLNKIDLQFMPEGGTLVNGIATNIAFKALNENGKPADIKGEIWDNEDNKIMSFESYHFGMGKFSFTPQKGKTYIAKITSPASIQEKFKLPVASNNGIVMNMSENDNKLLVKLSSTEDRYIELAGQTKNVIYHSQRLFLKKGEQVTEIDERKFPAGIAQFTIYNEDELPIAERLVFLNENKVLQVKITTDKDRYLPREKVTMTLQTLDEKGDPVPSNFSVAVVDDKLWSFADDKQDHILSWLLMSSELRGKIEEPQFYFKKDEPKAVPALDLVMLTHGYRYFDYIEYVQKEGKLKFTPDQPNILSGVVLNDKQQPVKASVFLVNPNTGEKALNIKTGSDGIFFFSDLAPRTNYYLIAQSLKEKEKVTIKVLQNGIGYNPLKAKQLAPLASKFGARTGLGLVNPVKKEEAEKVNLKIIVDKKEEGRMNETHLDEVVIVGYGAAKRKDLTAAVAVVRNEALPAANNLGFLLEGKVAGLDIEQQANPAAGAVFKIRGAAALAGGNEPLYVVNGIPVEKFEWNFNPNDIESITILKDASATAIYGARAVNGVIAIESKKFRNQKIRLDLTKKYYYITQMIQAGGSVYSVAKRFYAPRYHSTETSERNDFRETIYWNPVVQTDKNGKASVEFYNSDASTTFRAIAEGIAYNGKIGRAEATYTTRNAITVDAKIPPYLTVGDKALIPLVIKNNTEQNADATISLHLPGNIKTGDYDNKIILTAGESRQVLIPAEATAAAKGSIQFMVKSQFNTETISLPVVASDKGFPVIETFSGNKSARHNFTINKMIPGTLQSHLKVFQNLEGQLLDGIESMLREPGGCFEQTSSTTYPNIYVLKYLREAGKSNPAIEKKALSYIENGYNRLIGFETAQNGFEWFGHTPAHEALTAYGLLEFTDMQEFIDVDKKMMERTKTFLMSRRDGKGSFSLASGGYDRFASVPDKIANIYIVYALTQAGIGNEIQQEYRAAVNKAIDSNDAYQLAMMALAASNMKNENDYARLMELLNTNYQTLKLSAETSVVNSRDASLRVESMSLYTLALAREKSPRIGLMAELVSKILGEKSYYGYGSTQATVLALHAIVEYSKLIGTLAPDSQVAFTLNDQAITPGTSPLINLRNGENSFDIHYENANKTIPYNLEVSYNTLTPPNSAKAELKLSTRLKDIQTKVGETVRMEIEVKNERSALQPMAIAKIGVPAGLAVQPWQLKEIMEKNEVAYYEIFDNYLVLYWMGFAPNEIKKVNLDLKAEIAGTYKGKASNTCLYYTPEYKNWNDGVEIEVKP